MKTLILVSDKFPKSADLTYKNWPYFIVSLYSSPDQAKMRISQALVLVLLLCITSADDSVTKIIMEDIEHISRFLKKELVPDVEENNKHI